MLALALALALTADGGTSPDAGTPPEPALAQIKRIAKKVEGTPRSPWVRAFIKAAQQLPPPPKMTVWHSPDRKTWMSDADAKLNHKTGPFIETEVDEELYYSRIADPLGYMRPFDVLAEKGFDPKGKKVLDLGYGSIGQLKMLASIGAKVTGIEVHPSLPLIYASEKNVNIIDGYFGQDPTVAKAAGKDFDLWMSKNTLKKGYVHPDKGSGQIDLGPDDAALAQIHDMLKKGGLFYIYNFGPTPKPDVPMSDIRCPWSKEQLEKAGFEVLAFDVDDTAKGREAAKLMEWDVGPDGFDVDHDLFSSYVLARRK
jgi:SAM-dependent methyltransferase